ncbi:MAG TPA: isoprenylcysteine carboxylmethyltransferase family protein [Verrucomicrobiae bacterium]|nr:isoprenylcysteine carboxylmethyltransferase family protein [Verrucomicrobiae bacterium]
MGIFLPIVRNFWAELAAAIVFLSWLGYGVVFLVGKSRAEESHRVREVKSHAGFALQIVAYAGSCAISRQMFTPIFAMPRAAEIAVSLLTIVLAAGSVGFALAAARALDRQWALVARVIEGHELIQRGPYAVVRNPIYLAMFGTLLATDLAFSQWQGVVPSLVIFLAGTAIRVRTEEKLLRQAFREEFDAYARRVPAFLPGIY